MRSNSLNSNIEISGQPGLVWGNIIVPTAGRSKIRIKIAGDLLQSNISSPRSQSNKPRVHPCPDWALPLIKEAFDYFKI
ncbi:hypothetical protein H6G80_32780 [Nostoc sp. FACHB-87]|uniref:hypothetical protein n=1 Tax=Nostocaceae TaxID=1162 RepID=UPI0016824419|nr:MULTISPECIES: hypothetical protein [Nostocaceae]MBD2458820.1 hypothetical protein [Nostoc sp. FACHB-87]MBD2479875.1 hypothetical protein [Anabaena sp. FACHB-83]